MKYINEISKYFLFPNVIIFYCFYYNDFFNVDLFNLNKINNLTLEIDNIKNTIIVEDQKIYKIDETTSNINNVGLYIIYGLCICAIIYIGYNYFDGYGDAEIIIENSTKNSMIVNTNVKDCSDSILKNQKSIGQGILTSIAAQKSGLIEIIKSSTELNKEIIKSQNIYIDNQCASTRDIINNVFINLKQLINDVHMKSIVNGHRINLLLNHFDLDPAINTTTVQLLENNSYSFGNGILLNGNVRINSEERKLC